MAKNSVMTIAIASTSMKYRIVITYPALVLSSSFHALLYFTIKVLRCEFSPPQELNLMDIN